MSSGFKEAQSNLIKKIQTLCQNTDNISVDDYKNIINMSAQIMKSAEFAGSLNDKQKKTLTDAQKQINNLTNQIELVSDREKKFTISDNTNAAIKGINDECDRKKKDIIARYGQIATKNQIEANKLTILKTNLVNRKTQVENQLRELTQTNRQAISPPIKNESTNIVPIQQNVSRPQVNSPLSTTTNASPPIKLSSILSLPPANAIAHANTLPPPPPLFIPDQPLNSQQISQDGGSRNSFTFKCKTSKRKTSKRKISKRKISKRKTSKRKTSKRKTCRK